MRRDVFHYFDTDVQTVYKAYLDVLRAKPFGKEPGQTPYRLLSFGIGYSFKYNMNGAGVHVHFAPKGRGTAIQVRYSIAQLFGARYGAYDRLLTKCVEEKLHIKAQELSAMEDSFFEQTAEIPSSSGASFCSNCGKALQPDDRFCPGCGKKVG